MKHPKGIFTWQIFLQLWQPVTQQAKVHSSFQSNHLRVACQTAKYNRPNQNNQAVVSGLVFRIN